MVTEIADESEEVVAPEEDDIFADLPEDLVPPEIVSDPDTSGGKPGWKPDISGLPDAIVAGKLTVGKGERLLIQYPQGWRDTAIYVVKEVNPQGLVKEGYVRLYDPLRLQYAGTDYIRGPSQGLIFKVPDSKTRLIPGKEGKKRSRKGRIELQPKPEKPAPVLVDGVPVKRGRGRPKGSKNKTR